MIKPEIQFNLDRLAKTAGIYAHAADKTESEALAKMASELAWNIYKGMKAIAPAKGSIRAERLAALAAGEGVHVREAVMLEVAAKYGAVTSVASGSTFLNVRKGSKVVAMSTMVEGRSGKQMNLQALAIEREINIRESARGFSAYAVPRPPSGLDYNTVKEATVKKDSRYGFSLSEFDINLGVERKFAKISWFGRNTDRYESAVEGLTKDRQQGILNSAIESTRANAEEYIDRKLAETGRRFWD